MTNAIQDQTRRLSKDGEMIAFDLESRTLILKSSTEMHIAKLSHTEAHLLLSLVHFYPYDVSDSLLAQGYLINNINKYYEYIEACTWITRRQDIMMPIPHELIKDGIERLRKKVKKFGMIIPRSHKSGYVLKRRGV